MMPSSKSSILQMTISELDNEFQDQFNFNLFIYYLNLESKVEFNPKSKIIICK